MKSEEELDAMMNIVKQHGGTIVKPPQKTSWGGYRGYFRDLDGYYWELAYASLWEFDANDMLIIS